MTQIVPVTLGGTGASTAATARTNLGAAASGVNGDVTSATALTTLPAVTSVNSGSLSGLRNRLINGCMRIDQRNSGASQTFTAGAALAYSVDRWYGYCTGANVTGQRVAGSGNTQYRYQFTGAASVTKIGFAQRIEAVNCFDMNNRTATLGVELANSLLTTVTWTAWYANTADTFGTLASPTRTQIATGTFTVTSTPTRYYTPISIPAAATTGIEIEFSVGAQTSGTWTIGEVQLVPGGANELWQEKRPVGLELLLCQRYCNAIRGSASGPVYGNGVCNTTTDAYLLIPFTSVMRTTPTTCTQSSTASEFKVFKATTSIVCNATPVFDSGFSTPSGAIMNFNVAAGLTAGQAAMLQLAGSSYLIFSAEL